MWNMYKKAEEQFWTAEEFEENNPTHTTESNSEDYRTVFARLLIYDTKSALDRLACEIPLLEGKTFLNYQSMMQATGPYNC
jgi:hypothetical protein